MTNKLLAIIAGTAAAVIAGKKVMKIVEGAKTEHIKDVRDEFLKDDTKIEYAKAQGDVAAMRNLFKKEDKRIDEAIRNSQAVKDISDKIADKASDIRKLETDLELAKSNGMSLKIGDLEVNTSDSEKISHLEKEIDARKRELTDLKCDLTNERGSVRESIRATRTKADNDIILKGSKAEDYIEDIDKKIAALAKEDKAETIGKYLKKHNYDKTLVMFVLYAPLALAAYGGYKYLGVVRTILNSM